MKYALANGDQYKVLNISRKGIENGMPCACQNCGTAIVNFANIENQKGEKFLVGLDCVKTLTKSITNFSVLDESLYQFNLGLRFMTCYNKATKVESDSWETRVTYLDKNGKEKEAVCYTGLLKEYGIYKLISLRCAIDYGHTNMTLQQAKEVMASLSQQGEQFDCIDLVEPTMDPESEYGLSVVMPLPLSQHNLQVLVGGCEMASLSYYIERNEEMKSYINFVIY